MYTLNVSEKKRLVRHSTALVQCTAWQRKQENCTRAVEECMCSPPGVSMSSSVTRVSLVLPFFNRISCVHSFVRSFVIAIPWRHRIVFSPVVAVSHRRSHISGMHPDTKRHSNSFEDTSLRFSRTQSSEHARLSSSPPNPQPFVRVVAENSQKCELLFFLVSTKGNAGERRVAGKRRAPKALKGRDAGTRKARGMGPHRRRT